jgi:uncharacterized protein YxjI
MTVELYFKDNFFSAGETPIMDAAGEQAGTMDLQSMLSASLSVYGPGGELRVTGSFRFFSGKWEVADGSESVLGILKRKITFFSKRFEYDAGSRGVYTIESPAFSHSYAILDHAGTEVASFAKTSSWLESGAFCLQNHAEALDSYELIAVVMGVHSIQKRNNHAAASAST